MAEFVTGLSIVRPPANGLLDASQHKAPIYDSCDHCGYSIRPGEHHGVVDTDPENGEPKLVCKIQRLELVESVIPVVPKSIRG